MYLNAACLTNIRPWTTPSRALAGAWRQHGHKTSSLRQSDDPLGASWWLRERVVLSRMVSRLWMEEPGQQNEDTVGGRSLFPIILLLHLMRLGRQTWKKPYNGRRLKKKEVECAETRRRPCLSLLEFHVGMLLRYDWSLVTRARLRRKSNVLSI